MRVRARPRAQQLFERFRAQAFPGGADESHCSGRSCPGARTCADARLNILSCGTRANGILVLQTTSSPAQPSPCLLYTSDAADDM
eukprot:4492019-Alexandrium_andersonii.AAC.1